MYLFDFFKNTVKDKNIKAMVYLVCSMLINVGLFWLIYEKWLKHPNGIIIGIGLYIVVLFVFSSQIGVIFYLSFFPKKMQKDRNCCPNARRLFDEIKKGYFDNGFQKARGLTLKILDSEFLQDSNEIFLWGNNIFVNSMADHLEYSYNRGRFIYGIEMVMAGYGKGLVVGIAANVPIILLLKVWNFTSHLVGHFVDKFIINTHSDREKQIFAEYIFKLVNLCARLCSDNYEEGFLKFADRIEDSEYCDDVMSVIENFDTLG